MEENLFYDDERLALEPTVFVAQLREEERMLIQIRDELYEGSWDLMRRDLENRLHGKPYIFKLVSRIEHDLTDLAVLRAYEEQHRVNLAEFL